MDCMMNLQAQLTQLGDQPYCYVDTGGDGPVLVLLHGFPMSHQQWQPQLERFAVSHRVIAPDLRGLGESTITDSAATISMEQHADDIVTLLQQLSVAQPVTVMGLSMGGYILWQLIQKYPQKLAKIVLCHTRTVADTPEQAMGREKLADTTLSENSADPVLATMLPRLLPEAAPQSVRFAVTRMARGSSPAGLAATLRGLATRPDASEIPAQVRVPTLVITGELDVISPPAEMQSWAQRIPQHEFVCLPGVGHLSPLEAPDLFHQALTGWAAW
jgi:pimeloyl-ACP methyl ester carboxylesterase